MPDETFNYRSCAADLESSSERLVLRRREFLQQLVAGTGLLLSGTSFAGTTQAIDATPATLTDAVRDSPWPTLAAVQAHLFPSEAQAPGAKEINAIDYLRGALNSPGADPEERNFIFAGVAWLRGWAGMPFGDLTEAQREQLMRKMAGSKDGQNWIAVQLYYILEALLSDPVYGGNPDSVGWKWLGYVPGFPRPQEGTRYFELLEK